MEEKMEEVVEETKETVVEETEETAVPERAKIIKARAAFITELAGAGLVILGCLLPMYYVEFWGVRQDVAYIEGDGLLVVIAMLALIVLTLMRKQLFSSVFALVAIWLFINTWVQMSELGKMVRMGAGFYIALLGLSAIVCGIIFAIVWETDKKGKKSNKHVPIVICGSVVFAVVCILVGAYLSDNTAYKKAMQLQKEKNYESAIEKYEELDDFKESKKKLKQCRLAYAEVLLEEGNFEAVHELLDKLGSGKEVTDLQTKCDYLEAKDLLENGEYQSAREKLEALNGYEDSLMLIGECDFEEIKAKHINSTGSPVAEIKEIMQLRNYPDREAYCRELIQDTVEGFELFYNYDDAIDFLIQIEDVIDVKKELNECKIAKLADMGSHFELFFQDISYAYPGESYVDSVRLTSNSVTLEGDLVFDGEYETYYETSIEAILHEDCEFYYGLDRISFSEAKSIIKDAGGTCPVCILVEVFEGEAISVELVS